jgi:hypothetical protein
MYLLYYVKPLAVKWELAYTCLIIFYFRENVELYK